MSLEISLFAQPLLVFKLSWSHCLQHAYAQDCVGLKLFENKMFIGCTALLKGWTFYLVTTAGLLSIIICLMQLQ